MVCDSPAATLNTFAQTSSIEHPINLTEPNESKMISIDSDDSENILQVCDLGWSKVTTNQGPRIHQEKRGCMQNGVRDPEQPAAADVTVDEKHEPFFQTPEPPPCHQTAPNTYRPRALVYSTDAEQTTPPTTAVRPREDKEEKQRDVEYLNMRAELQKRIQIRQLKMAEVFDLKVSLDNEWLETYNVFSEVMKVVEDALERSLQPLKKRRERVNREGEDLLQRLKRETEELQKTITELDRNPDLQISLDETTDWSNTSVETSLSFDSLITTTAAMMEPIERQLEELSLVDLK